MVNPSDRQDPFDLDRVYRFNPKHVTERLAAQSGVFTIHNTTTAPVDDAFVIAELRLTPGTQRYWRTWVYGAGVHEESMFPGLDGLARHLRWLRVGD